MVLKGATVVKKIKLRKLRLLEMQVVPVVLLIGETHFFDLVISNKIGKLWINIRLYLYFSFLCKSK